MDEPLLGLEESEQQDIPFDIMNVNGIKFLVTVIKPIGMTLCDKLSSADMTEVLRVLRGHIGTIKSRGFKVIEAYADPEFEPLTTSLGNIYNIRLDVSGQKEKDPYAERTIRIIKERTRGIYHTLPFKLTLKLLSLLVLFSASRISMVPSVSNNTGASGWERFYGLKLDYKKNFKAGFGDYVQAHNNASDNTMKSRTTGGLTLYDTGNKQGSWYIYNLETGRIIKRNKFTILPMPDVVINFLNNQAEAQGQDGNLEFTMGLRNARNLQDDNDENDEDRAEAAYNKYMDHVATKFIKVSEATEVHDPIAIELDYSDDTSDDTIEGVEIIHDDSPNDPLIATSVTEDAQDYDTTVPEAQAVESLPIESAEEEPPIEDSAISRLRPNRAKPGRYSRREYGYHTYVKREYGLHMTPSQAIEKLGKRAKVSMMQEVEQLLRKKTWHGVLIRDLSDEEVKRIIPSKIFVKEKYTASGTFDKLKSMLVGGGHRQKRYLYKDQTSSPTVSTTCVFTVATIAHKERRAIATIDFPGAYLEAYMPKDNAVKVHMRLKKQEADFVVQLDPSYEQYLQDDGSLIVELDKAIYGLIESALLWYKHLCDGLSALDYSHNPYDRCVFNRVEADNTQSTLVVHVDDGMLTANSEDKLTEILSELRDQFKLDITVKRGKIHDYLGMVFDFTSSDYLSISMDAYVSEVLKECNVAGTAPSPCNNNIFHVDDNSKLLERSSKEYFHSTVAKLLYLSKRVRPDLLLTICFLATRVRDPTEQDLGKLNRLLMYLNGTKHLMLKISADNIINISAYVDASYGTHSDYKSHSGCTISMGRGVIYRVFQLNCYF